MARATVHVILPTYQPNEEWLATQVRSILAQSCGSLQVWLSPDGPDSEVAAFAENLGDPRLTALSFENRVGVVANVQRALERALAASASGDLFAFADQDDIWHPEKLAKGIACLPSCPVAISTHDARVVAADGRLLAPSLHVYEKRHRYLDQFALLMANSISGMTVLATGETVRRALPFPDSVPGLLHDWWLALVASGLGRIGRLDEPLVDYRLHSGNVIGPKRAGGSALIRFPPKRLFLGPSYRNVAREAFRSRQAIALELKGRDALSEPAAAFFLDRRIGSAARLWHGSARRFAIRCAIGMLLAGPGADSSGGRRSEDAGTA